MYVYLYMCQYDRWSGPNTIDSNSAQGSGVYIDAYDAETSNTYMLTLAAEDIPALLVRALSLVHISICMHTYMSLIQA